MMSVQPSCAFVVIVRVCGVGALPQRQGILRNRRAFCYNSRMSATWLGTQFSPFAPGLWLVVGLLLTLLLRVWLLWLPSASRGPLWAAHWLLVPYAGLLVGGLSPRLLGLTAHDWVAGLGLGLGIILAVVALLALARALVDWEMSDQAAPTQDDHDRAPTAWTRILATVGWSGLEQFHWVFLRGAVWEMLLALPTPPDLPGYWAIWVAAALIGAEALLWRPAWLPLLVQAVTLTTTSILFFYTHNFWLCWALHAAVHLTVMPVAWLPLSPLRLRPRVTLPRVAL